MKVGFFILYGTLALAWYPIGGRRPRTHLLETELEPGLSPVGRESHRTTQLGQERFLGKIGVEIFRYGLV